MAMADPLFVTIVLLASGVFGLALARFAHISPILGFFVIGAVIGPQGLGFIDKHSHTIHFLGELGVSFLLFDIGLHISLQELRKTWRGFFLAGTMQFLVVSAALAFMIRQLGFEWLPSIAVGAIASLSSTALVLKILADENEESSPVGKRATEILVFQDMVAILLLVLLSGDIAKGITPSSVAVPILKMAVSALLVVTIGRMALKPLFKLLISLKSDEVITAFALLMVLLTYWATQSIGLSLAYGAFLGGLALSESSHSYLVRSEVAPFRSLLLSLFFLSVGINLDCIGMLSDVWLLTQLLVFFSLIKAGANIIAFKISRVDGEMTTLLGFLLAQGSEFAFVLLAIAGSSGLLDERTQGLAVSLVGLSLAITPMLGGLGCLLSRKACKIDDCGEVCDDDPREVIIVRIDDLGRQLAGLLDGEHIPYRAHDSDLERLAYAKVRGLNVYYSDLNRPRTLGRVSLGKALAVVSLVEDDHVLTPLIEGLHKIEPVVPIIAATESHARLEMLSTLGVESSYIKNESTVVVVFESLMRALHFEEGRIERAVRAALELLAPDESFPRLGNIESAEAQPMAA